MILQTSTITCHFNETTLQFHIDAFNHTWSSLSQSPYLICHQERMNFLEAASIQHRHIKDNTGEGILSDFTKFPHSTIHFQTLIWISTVTGEVSFHWIPMQDSGIEEVFWPMPFIFNEPSADCYSLLPLQQGLLLPNTWPKAVHEVPFAGAFCSSSAYMPWFSQIHKEQGYLLINDTPWDSAYTIDHPANGPYTHLGIRWMSSLNHMAYRRSLRIKYFSDCDYNTIAKAYRKDAQERGIVVTLAEKCQQNPSIDALIGSCFLHKGIKTHVQPESRFFDKHQPTRFESLTTFKKRQAEIHEWKQLGVDKLYLHLDGWGKEGYDNLHPAILPPCEQAGGWQGLKDLQEEMHRCQYLFGLHDQYRDYYHRSPAYHIENSVHAADATIPSHAYWAGGKQDYLCASLAKTYIMQNYQELFQHDIHPDAVYLDVFTCNELDECNHPMHRMTRKECLTYRNACFAWLLSQHILTSSEEVNEWALPYQVFAHYAPYHFMMHSYKEARIGIPVPLFNLVYHDCVILPWPMDICKEQEDYMLYALLNGGAPYLEKDGAYPNTDGVFNDEYVILTKQDKIKRAKIVTDFQKLVAKEEMVKHEFINGDPLVQRTVFANGCSVMIDLHKNRYTVSSPDKKEK